MFPCRFILIFLLVSILLASARAVRADGLRWFLEYGYHQAQTVTSNAAEERSESDSRGFAQKYRLDFDRRLFPALTLRGGGIFEKSDSEATRGGEHSDSHLTRSSPFIDLLLANPLYNAGIGFRRLQDDTRNHLTPENTIVRDAYNANFGWRPQGLPSFYLQYSRSETADRQRRVEDAIHQRLLLTSSYKPRQELQISYQGVVNQLDDALHGIESNELLHSGRLEYSDRFWHDRLTLGGSYGISNRSSRSTHRTLSGAAEVALTVPAFAGLFALDGTPTEGELVVLAPLVDGNIEHSAGVNIGLSAGGPPSELRNMGIDLLHEETESNGFWIYIDRALPAVIASSFRWDIYTSHDGISWKLHTAVSGVPLGPFVNRFEIRFPTVRSRFIKAAVGPLSPVVPGALEQPNIFVTELQPIMIRPVEEATGSTSVTAQQINITSRLRILPTPLLHYETSLFYATSGQAQVSRLFLANGLSLQHRFGPRLNATAHAAREDTVEPRGDRVAYRYGFSLNSMPLPPLSHTLAYSSRIEHGPDGLSRRNALFLNNRATLYRGIDLLLNGGVNFGSNEVGEDTESLLIYAGTTLTPHRTMTWNFSLSADRSRRSGGGRPPATHINKGGLASVSWNPLAAVGLFASLEAMEQQGESRTLRNMAVNWAPLRDGALQFSVNYNEHFRPQEEVVDRLIAPNIRLEIRRNMFLTLSYALIEAESRVQKTETRLFSGGLQASF